MFDPRPRVWHRVVTRRLSLGFVVQRAHHVGCTRRIIRRYYADEFGSLEQEQRVLKGTLRLLVGIPKEFTRSQLFGRQSILGEPAEKQIARMIIDDRLEVVALIDDKWKSVSVSSASRQPNKGGRPKIPPSEQQRLLHLRDHCNPKWEICDLVREFLIDQGRGYSDPDGAIHQRLTKARRHFPPQDCPYCHREEYPQPRP